jgi:hypothetical protein
VVGQVMWLVALTLGCLALGAYIGRDLSGGLEIPFLLAVFACVFGLNVASSQGRQQLTLPDSLEDERLAGRRVETAADPAPVV